MPTYDYECSGCGKRFELFQSGYARPIKKCILCGKSKARRLMSAGSGLIFKGSGFYITDYKRPAPSDTKPARTDSTPSKPPPSKPTSPGSKPSEKKGKP